jgi:hypothetical protein
MASLKRLRSVAHNVAHQFASTLNYVGDDYAVYHVVKTAKAHNIPIVVIDMLTGRAVPETIEVDPIPFILAALRPALYELLRNEGHSIEILSAATLTYNVAVDRVDLKHHLPVYDCTACLVTKDGKRFEAHLNEHNK